jgi:hypothetical protein
MYVDSHSWLFIVFYAGKKTEALGFYRRELTMFSKPNSLEEASYSFMYFFSCVRMVLFYSISKQKITFESFSVAI